MTVSRERIVVLGVLTMHLRLLPISNESQPLILLFGLLFLTKSNYSRANIVLLLSVISSTLFAGMFSDYNLARFIIIDVIILALGPMYLLLSENLRSAVLKRESIYALKFLAISSIVFYVFGDLIDSTSVQKYVPITDYSFGPLSGGKGIKLFSAEPSHSAYQLFFFLCLLGKEEMRSKILYSLIFLFTNRSITFTLLLCLVFLRDIGFRHIYRAFAAAIALSLFEINSVNRLQKIVSMIPSLDAREIVLSLSRYGSTRELSNYLVWIDSKNLILPGGLASWHSRFLSRLSYCNFKINDISAFDNFAVAPLKPYSYLFLAWSDFGIFFLSLICFLIWKNYLRIFDFRELVLVVIVFCYTLPSSPIPWLLMTVLYNDKIEKNIPFRRIR